MNVRRTLIVLWCVAWGAPAHAEQEAPATPPRLLQNFSDMHEAVEWIDRAFETAKRAAKRSDWLPAVRALQRVIDATQDREHPTHAAPYVRPIRGRVVYEGAWIVAQHALARLGPEGLAAYRAEYGAAAKALLAAGVWRWTTLARRFLSLPQGRTAALLLADLALERGQPDEALEWLESLEDLEAVSAEPAEALAKWRAARIDRHARALAGPGDLDAVHAALVERARRQDEPDHGLHAVPFRVRAPAVAPSGWTTTGGHPSRSAVPASLGSSFELGWWRSAAAHGDLMDSEDPEDGGATRPTTWLPPRGIVMPAGLFVSDGMNLLLYDVDSGELLARQTYQDAQDIGHDVADDRRERFGWLEGHCLTGRVAPDGTTWIYAAVPDGRAFDPSVPNRTPRPRHDRLEALVWNGRTFKTRWVIGGVLRSEDLPSHVRLYGAPAWYRGRLWIAGMRASGTSSDRWQAWVFSLDPDTGAVLTKTHVGTGTPVRPTRQDEVIPSSPAAARGRVVVSTSLGIVAAVDARDGRMRWALRNDRDINSARRVRGRISASERAPRGTGFVNEPPILLGERCYVAPMDGQLVYVLFNRPIGRDRMLKSRSLHQQTDFGPFRAEFIAGVAPHPEDGAPLALFTGRGVNRTPPAPVVVARVVSPPRTRWSATPSTGLGASTFGRALVTAREVFVPTHGGVEVFDLATGEERTLLNLRDVPKEAREALPRPYGNVIPLPGKGFITLSTTSVAFWKRKD